MKRILQRVVNKVMGAFVGSGVTIDEDGRLCLPDGLCPRRVHRFIELVMDERFVNPRDALHALFSRIGVSARAVGLLNEIIDTSGDVDFGEATRHAGALMQALPELQQIPARFRVFLVEDLALASVKCSDLEEAVVSARQEAARRIGCVATWDAILENADALVAVTQGWREGRAVA